MAMSVNRRPNRADGIVNTPAARIFQHRSAASHERSRVLVEVPNLRERQP
jgi:hypothetical protein